jgi:hypothetical protein
MGSGYRTLWLCVAFLLVNAMFALRVYSQVFSPTRITVLSADFHPINDGTPIPKNCDMQNFDAYCNESKNPTGQNIMRVKDSDGNTFTITCTIDSRWSRCAPLGVGETYEAKRGKHGLTVWIQNPNGKESTRLYKFGEDAPALPGASAAAQPVGLPPPSGDLPNSHPLGIAPGQKAPLEPSAAPPASASSTQAPATSVPPAQSAAPAPAPPTPATAPARQAESAQEAVAGEVKCNFTSTPSGAEITLDGKYVGSTPSAITLSPGAHTVSFSLPGFVPWTRNLTVSPGSELSVSAILQKGKK